MLPLPWIRQLRVAADLRGDDGVGIAVVQVAPRDPVPPVLATDTPDHFAVVLDLSAGCVGPGMPADLLVKGRQYRMPVHRRMEPERRAARTKAARYPLPGSS